LPEEPGNSCRSTAKLNPREYPFPDGAPVLLMVFCQKQNYQGSCQRDRGRDLATNSTPFRENSWNSWQKNFGVGRRRRPPVFLQAGYCRRSTINGLIIYENSNSKMNSVDCRYHPFMYTVRNSFGFLKNQGRPQFRTCGVLFLMYYLMRNMLSL